MTAAEGPEESFRVTDRRRHAESEPPVPESEGRSRVEPSPPEPSVSEGAGEFGEHKPDLSGLFMMLASSALVALGEAPDPITGQAHPDPEQAAETIDLLILLREKTEGNRTPEESQILESIIYDLQVRYITLMKRS